MAKEHLQRPEVREKATAARFAGDLRRRGLPLTGPEFLLFRAHQLVRLTPDPYDWKASGRPAWNRLPSWRRALQVAGYDPDLERHDEEEIDRLGALYSTGIHHLLLRDATTYLADWARKPDGEGPEPDRALAGAADRVEALLRPGLDLLGALANHLRCGAWDRRWLYGTVTFAPAPGHTLQGPLPDLDLADHFVRRFFRRKKTTFTPFTTASPTFANLLLAVGALGCDDTYLRRLLTDLGVQVTCEERDRRRFRIHGLELRPKDEREALLDAAFQQHAPTRFTAHQTTALPVWALRRETPT